MYTTDVPSTARSSWNSSWTSRIQASDKPLLGAIISFPCTISAKIIARSGFQWVMIDMEHSPLSMGHVTELVHAVVAASQGSCLPLIRIPSDNTQYLKWALDSGAAGIVVPMVHTAGQMETIIQLASYPPRGSRSFGPYNAPFTDSQTQSFGDYYQKAQTGNIAILPIIESREGVRNVEEILSIDGATGAFIGPYDLRLSMGLPGGSDGDEREFVTAVEKICTVGQKLGKPIGSMGSGEALACKRTQQGMKFLLTSFDHNTLLRGVQLDLQQALVGVEKAHKL